MQHYEYRVIPAPAKGVKAPGVKGPEARFAHALETLINEMAAQGWDYLRADILPSEERQGLTSSHTVYRSVLVFRRPVDPDSAEPSPDEGDLPEDAIASEVIEEAKTAAEDADPGEPADDPEIKPQSPGGPPNPHRGED